MTSRTSILSILVVIAVLPSVPSGAETIVAVSSFLACDEEGGGTTLLSIDSETGDRTVLSGDAPDAEECSTTGSGEPIAGLLAVTADADGAIFASDVNEFGGARILEIDPTTGARTVLSGCDTPSGGFGGPCTSLQVGSGPALANVTRLAVIGATLASTPGFQGDEGDLLLAAVLEDCSFPDGHALVHVDVATGDRTVVSGDDLACTATIGSGDPFADLIDLALPSDGSILVGDGFGTAAARVMSVDPGTGNRTVVSGCNEVTRGGLDSCTGSTSGSGPDLTAVLGLTQPSPPSGSLFALTFGDPGCPSFDRVVEIDPATGNRTIFSGMNDSCALSATGTQLIDANAMIDSPDGNFVVVEELGARTVSVDSTTGARAAITGCSDLTLDEMQFTVSCDSPETIIGTGPEPDEFLDGEFVPEPSIGILIAAGTLAFSLRADRRRRKSRQGS